MSLSNILNMAIFRRTNTPMSPDRERRRREQMERREREALAYQALGEAQQRQAGIGRTRRLIDELSNMTFNDEAETLTASQVRRMQELMFYGTSITRGTNRREHNEGGYDLVHKG